MERILVRKDSDILAMAIMVYALPRLSERVDALAVFCGMGESWRLTRAIEVWQSEKAKARYLLIGGQNDQEETWTRLTLKNLAQQPFFLRRQKGVYVNSVMKHTKHQAEWLAEKAGELGISSLALFVSPYHLLR